MANPLRSELARWLVSEGWELSVTGGGHIKGLHPKARKPLFFAATTGDTRRQPMHVRTQARRLLREAEEGA